ncbi:hypothetical protein QZM85_13645, partial [Burkholderia cenocepacia]|nr:hypothetical protein [Burkholderia cenocepacia]
DAAYHLAASSQSVRHSVRRAIHRRHQLRSFNRPQHTKFLTRPISPEMNFNDISDATPQETYTHLVEQLRSRNLAYLHVALFNTSVDYHALLRPRFEGAYLVGGGLDQGKAESMLAAGHADATVFGSAFLANPDLPERFRVGAALNLPDKNTFYTPGAQGYIDYPMLDRAGED